MTDQKSSRTLPTPARGDCRACPRREVCVAICPALEARLPQEDQGGSPARLSLLARRRLVRRRRELAILLDRRHRLSGLARRVFDLRFNEALGIRRLARRLGLSRASVRRVLRRAQARPRARATTRRAGSRRASGRPAWKRPAASVASLT
ncbi:MAG: hypothetical protein HY719_08550 [Planctomycetes bacterium]|nr:hypothetical protein [Planctomycetota bacterium]